MCVPLCVYAHAMPWMWKREDDLWIQSSPFPVRVPGISVRLPVLAAGAFMPWDISPATHPPALKFWGCFSSLVSLRIIRWARSWAFTSNWLRNYTCWPFSLFWVVYIESIEQPHRFTYPQFHSVTTPVSCLLSVVDRAPKTYYTNWSPVYSLILLITVLGWCIRSLSCSSRIIASLCPLIYIPLCSHFSQLCLKRGSVW